MNKFLLITITSFFCFMVGSCNHDSQSYQYVPSGKVYPKKSRNSSDAAVIYYSKKLESEKIDVINIGQGHLLVIPNSILFTDQASTINWESYKTLNDVIEYIKLHNTAEITISTFVSHYGSKERQKALSLARASEVKNYFWSQNIDSRLIISQGFGSAKEIVNENGKISGDQSQNSRTEIRFFDLIK